MNRALPWLTFVLGVLLTVGVYEGARALSDTYRAISGQGLEREASAVPAKTRASATPSEARVDRKAPPKAASASRDRRAKKPTTARRERLKNALDRLSSEERDALKTEVIARRESRRDKRQNRAEEKREKRQALLSKVRDDMAQAAGEDVMLGDEVLGMDEEAMLEALEEEFFDTAEPSEE
jgi:hypothetical protein